MRGFQNLSIQRKLILIIMVTSIVALLLAAVAYSTYDLVNFRRSMVRELAVLANIVGANSRAALVFNDQKSAEETLAAIAAEEHIVAAILYTKDGEVFAKYLRSDLMGKFTPPIAQGDRHGFENNYLILFRRLMRQDEVIGTIYLRSDTSVFYSRLKRFVGIGGLVMLGVSFIAFLLSSRLQKIISGPILHLTQTAWVVSDEKDYSIRAVKQGNDELGFLIDRFNEMLGRIQDRDRELSALLDVAATATQSLDIGTVLREVAQKITTIFELDSTRIYLCEKGGQELRLRANAGENLQGLYQELFKLGEGIVGHVAKTGTRIVFEDIQNDQRYNALSHSGTLGKAGYRFFAVFAIKTKGTVLGAISCNSRQVRRPSPDEIRLIESLADQLAPAIENLNLFGEVQEKSAELEKANLSLSEYSVELARNNTEIERANQRLLELDRLKSHFLSNVSHELKTPLTAISGLVDNMLDGLTGMLNEKQSRYIVGIKESSERLTRLINDLLDLSVVESGRVRLEPTRFSLSDLVHQVASTMTAVAQAKPVTLELPVTDGNYMAWADRDRISQVLTNLIGNAIKFTPKGGNVSITIAPAENDGWLSISVSDTGPGIPEDDRAQIFDEFYQISRPGEEKARGVGLGLAISKTLVEMNGGMISVQSNQGTGSTFTFTVAACRDNLTTAELHRGAGI